MGTIVEEYKDMFQDLLSKSRKQTTITPENVFQESNKDTLALIEKMVKDLLLPNSEIRHQENLKELLERVKEGQKALILMEHYSNLDLPQLVLMLKESGETGKEIADRLVAIAGMKLNEDDPVVCAFAESYSRVVIYPSRSLASITDPEQHKEEEARSRKINLASMRAFDTLRKEGKIFLVFPSGTRYRPGHPETKRGVREIDSYIRLSDVMVLISVNGNCLRIPKNSSSQGMLGDIVAKDRIVLDVSPVYSCHGFREEAQEKNPGAEDPKQVSVDHVMNLLAEMHETNEKGRI